MTTAFLEVHVDGRARLVRLDTIREIVAMCDAQPTEADDPVAAVLNLRGDIVPLLDLSTERRALGPDRFVLVCTAEMSGHFGLVVDDVMDIQMVPDDQLDIAPGRPPYARIDTKLFPVVLPEKAWTQREHRPPSQPRPVEDASARRLLASRAERYASHDLADLEDFTEHALFERGGHRFAVDLESLREIRTLSELCKVPGSAPHIPGVVHSRGQLLSAHDLGAFLSHEPVPADYRWLVIVEDGDRQLALLADDVQGIRPVALSQCKPVPIALGPGASCFSGVAHDDVLLLSPAGLFDTPSFSHAEENP